MHVISVHPRQFLVSWFGLTTCRSILISRNPFAGRIWQLPGPYCKWQRWWIGKINVITFFEVDRRSPYECQYRWKSLKRDCSCGFDTTDSAALEFFICVLLRDGNGRTIPLQLEAPKEGFEMLLAWFIWDGISVVKPGILASKKPSSRDFLLCTFTIFYMHYRLFAYLKIFTRSTKRRKGKCSIHGCR